MDIVSRHIEALSEHVSKARSVEHCACCKDSVFRQTAELPRNPGHDVTRVSDDDNDSVWTVLDQFRDDALEDFDVLLHQVKTSLSFLLTSSGCDDDHSRILQPSTYQLAIVAIFIVDFSSSTSSSPSNRN